MTAKKDLIGRVVDEDAARIDRFEACAKLIVGCRVESLQDLVGLCFASAKPSEDQFDLLCDTWHAHQHVERRQLGVET